MTNHTHAPNIQFDDGRGRFPDRVGVHAPLGMRERIRRAAQLANTTSAAFVRAAIEDRLRQVGPSAEPL